MTYLSEALRWALPRLAVYALAALAGVLAFTVWAVVYTFIWPGTAFGHDADTATSPEQARVYEMYQRWMRPEGGYNGIGHRTSSCCNKTDCSLVLESRNVNGTLFVRPELNPTEWYPVPEKIQEINQPDPVESPDGRAHVCIMAGQVVCYTAGDGA